MKLNKILFLILCGITSAGAEPQFCAKPESNDAIQLIRIPSKPNYFFRTFPQAHLISYASDEGNYILDMNTSEQFSLPGDYDPVPLGEEVMSVPDSEEGMSFYSVKEILSGQSQPELLLRSKSLLGVYQSVGLVSKAKSHDIYAVIVAGTTGIVYQKIRVSYEPKLKVEEEGQVINFCEGLDIKLPMLSKDGREVSGLDGQSGTTKIWKLNFKNRTCVETDDVGLNAGKADFNFDGTSLVFHLRGDGSKDTEFFEKAESSMSMSVFSYNRKDKQIYKISHARPGDNSYFPVYRQDGSLVYAVVDRAGVAHFAHAFPSKLKLQALNLNALAQSPNLLAWFVIGQAWNLSCSQGGEALKAVESILSAALSLDRDQCLSLLNDKTEESLKEKIKALRIVPASNKDLKIDMEEVMALPLHEVKRACLLL